MKYTWFKEKIKEGNIYAPLSGFFPVKIVYDGKEYPSSEHLYQALRYLDTVPEYAEIIRTVRTPYAARLLGSQKKSYGQKRPWMIIIDEKILKAKTNVPPEDINLMKIAIQEKFTQSDLCREVLLSTTGLLICESQYDNFWSIKNTVVWGNGPNAWREYLGNNHIGKLLTQLRDNLMT